MAVGIHVFSGTAVLILPASVLSLAWDVDATVLPLQRSDCPVPPDQNLWRSAFFPQTAGVGGCGRVSPGKIRRSGGLFKLSWPRSVVFSSSPFLSKLLLSIHTLRRP